MSSHMFGCPCQDDKSATCHCDKILARDCRIENARLRDLVAELEADRDEWKSRTLDILTALETRARAVNGEVGGE